MTANAGYHAFSTGDVLTAAQVQYNLQNQTIMYFASSAARTTALSGVLVEGMFSYLADTDSTEYYNGSAWTSISNPGDITSVTAGTGITGGGTSGAVTITNDMATTITTAGDLIKGTGSGTYARLGIGSTGQVLTVASGAPTWATPAGGGGKVLQVVYAEYSTNVTITTDTSYSDTGSTITITPTLATSKILIFSALAAGLNKNDNLGQGGTFQLLRDSTVVFKQQASANSALFTRMATGDSSQTLVYGVYPINYLDSPATTSATTYKLQGKVLYSTASGKINCQSENTKSTMIAMEIGA